MTDGQKRKKLLSYWFYETIAFVLLPVLIYLIAYIATGRSILTLLELPEWMFIAIVLYGDTARRQILLYLDIGDPELRIRRTLAQVVIGIVVASSLLIILILSNSGMLELRPAIEYGQVIVFTHSLIYSAYNRVWAGLYYNEGEKLHPLQLD